MREPYDDGCDRQEARGEEACRAAALRMGLTGEQADACEDGEHRCPSCPWQKPTTAEAGDVTDTPNGYTFGQTLYRYDDTRVGSWDDDMGTSDGYRIEIDCRAYRVVKVTPRGAWIRNALGMTWPHGDRFVRWKGRKKYAYPTHAEAWESFLIRKRRRLEILQEQLEYAQRALSKAETRHAPQPCEVTS